MNWGTRAAPAVPRFPSERTDAFVISDFCSDDLHLDLPFTDPNRVCVKRFSRWRLQKRSRSEVKTGTMPWTNNRKPVDRAFLEILSRMCRPALNGIGGALHHENRNGHYPLLERPHAPCLERIEGTDGLPGTYHLPQVRAGDTRPSLDGLSGGAQGPSGSQDPACR